MNLPGELALMLQDELCERRLGTRTRDLELLALGDVLMHLVVAFHLGLGARGTHDHPRVVLEQVDEHIALRQRQGFGAPVGTGVTSTGGMATQTPAEKMLRYFLLR